ncbi:MAG: 30S ribosomal protein S4e [Thermoplasmata archaeon]|nr:30S ribosomal protein S4e [Thermoplasmata archaeon]
MTRRLKRGAAPRSWTVPRKGTKWILRPSPGPHPQAESMPLLLLLRDVLRIAQSTREARLLVRSGAVHVDGKIVTDLARGVGLMDTLALGAPLQANYRLFKDRRGKLRLYPIPADEATVKIGRIQRKTTVRGGRLQVTLHDGRNLRIPEGQDWKVGDSLKIHLPDQKVLGRLPFAVGHLAYVAGGSHVGELARIEKVEVLNSPQPNRVHFKEGFSTVKQYVFVVGEATPQITLPEGLNR